MANDGGVWARLPQPNNGGGIWTKTSSGWVEIGGGGGSDGLEGLGGWAEITEVSGSPKRYAYNDGPGGVGGMDWVAFEWTDTTDPSPNSLTTLAGGLADLFMISAGARADNVYPGSGGRTVSGLHKLEGTQQDITIGKKVTSGTERAGPASTLGSITTYYSAHFYGGSGATDSSGNSDEGRAGYPSNILGFDETFGETGDYYGAAHVPRANRGDGGKKSDGAGSDGVVIVRVPAAQAAGVDPGSWVTRIDYYAEVTDGIVTDLYQERFYGDDTVRTENGRYASPEQPDDLIPCDPSVAEGWTYADGEFTPPPPDPSWREEAIAALKQQLKDLQKDT